MTTVNRAGAALPPVTARPTESVARTPELTATPIMAKPGGDLFARPIIDPMPPVGIDPHGPPIFEPPMPPIGFPPRPFPIPFPPIFGGPRPQQTDLALMKARFEAMRNPGLESDTNELAAAKRDLAAYERYEPNSPRVGELQQLVGQLSQKVTGEATQKVDQALNEWFQSSGSPADSFKLLETLNQAQNALRQSAPFGSEAQFVGELKSYIESQLLPPRPIFW